MAGTRLAFSVSLAMSLAAYASEPGQRPDSVALKDTAIAALTHPEHVLVRFRAGTAAGVINDAYAKAGVTGVVWTYTLVPDLYCVRVPSGTVDAAINALDADAAVAYAGPDFYVHACVQTTPYGITMVNAPTVWPNGMGAGAVVAVLDTGFDFQHPDLPVPVLTSSFITGQAVDDLHSHGTHCAGIVLARDNTIGVVGVAPEAGLMVGKVLSNGGSGPTSGVIAGVDWAVANGAHVISMSLGGGGFDQAFLDSLTAAVAANVLVVAAAGNDNVADPHYPSSYPPVVSVMAVDSNRAKASFSNFGPHVDIGAPGVGTNSTIPIITANATWNGTPRNAAVMSGSDISNASGAAIYCGFGGEASDFPAGVAGNIAHIRRGGTFSFNTKANNALDAGAVGVIISNNTGTSPTSGTLNDTFPFPVIGISDADGDALQAISGVQTSITIAQTGSGYGNKSGTSMACPHVAGVAGLLLGIFGPDNVPVDLLRTALEATAEDLGDPGRDDIFGHGLVDAAAAYNYLLINLPDPCGSADFDGDGDTGTDADIEAFFACLGGSCCATCGSADFDNDGDTGTDADIEAWVRGVGGGSC